MKKRFKNIYIFLKDNEFVFMFMIALIIVGISSFSFGLAKGANFNKSPIEITKNNSSVICEEMNSFNNKKEVVKDDSNTGNCEYVGSINGKKFYPPSCPSVKRINPKNLTCFKTEKDALNRGYTRTKSCKY